MKLKLTFALLALSITTAFLIKTESYVAAETALPGSVVSNPTPAPKPKANRIFVFLDSWDGVKLRKPDAEWKKELNELEFYVLRKQGTERAYTGELNEILPNSPARIDEVIKILQEVDAVCAYHRRAIMAYLLRTGWDCEEATDVVIARRSGERLQMNFDAAGLLLNIGNDGQVIDVKNEV